MRLTKERTIRRLLVAAEVTTFFLFFLSFVFVLLDLVLTPSLDLFETWNGAAFTTMVLAGATFLVLPHAATYLRSRVEWVDQRVAEKRLERSLLATLKRERRVKLQVACAEHGLEETVGRALVERLVERGDLAGEIRDGGTFVLKDGFEVLPERERRVNNLRRNLRKFVTPYKYVELSKVAKAFKLPTSVVEEIVKEKLRARELRGFLDGGVLVRDTGDLALDLSDLPRCPNCHNVNLDDANFCSTCGASLEGVAPPPPAEGLPDGGDEVD
ncbi:MAG: hypothetical protein Kow0069_00370 [Promethearchaeota archaeon]